MCKLCELRKCKYKRHKKYYNTYCYNKPRITGPCLFGHSTYIYAGQSTMNLCCNN